ncbi:hydroxysqualene dehydroxylase [Hansschlegelia beijingensis]|uniref:Amine oxidase domain-containing protein n=1 Tax=Hansschlegelia beijingensis TaxID=1133344 RepID=A0A7W6D0T8_9HYPH|nr:FAD-dependent oxidoreductase [Hansschlegelia beijingensis]MBB3973912.1 hypothetical protein [Hansschlegelia beijingensis]
MSGAAHIVGGGVAGLAAAYETAVAGRRTVVYEAAPQLGGRCRTVVGPDGFSHDNGTHALLSCNTAATGFLKAIGALGDWVEPEPDGLPMVDARTGTARCVGLSPFSWLDPNRRPAGFAAADLVRLAAAALPLRDRPVAARFAASGLAGTFVDPLAVAVLNTRSEMASSRRLGHVLRRLARPGAARLMIPRRGLGPDMIEPAERALGRHGATIAFNARLRALAVADERVVRLDFGFGSVAVAPEDMVILALPPHEVSRLMPELATPAAFESIAGVHFALRGPAAPRLVGITGGLSQWVALREACASVTISAASDLDRADLADRVWPEVRAARLCVGLDASEAAPDARVLIERRATIRHAVGDPIGFPRTRVENLVFAGDWGGPLPATIEAAVASGRAAGRRRIHASRRSKRPSALREAAI